MKRTILILLFSTLVLAPAAGAGEFEITPFVGYMFGGDVQTYYEGNRQSVSINDSDNWGLALNLELSPMTEIELLYSTQDTGADARHLGDTIDLTIDYWQLSMLWNFNPGNGLEPYMVLGIGGTWLKPDGFSSLSRFSGNIGGGAKFYFSEHVGVRLEGRLYGTYVNSEISYCDPWFCYGYNNSLLQFDVTAGLIIRFGG